MANNLLFIVLVVAGVLLLTGGLTGNLAYRLPYRTPTYDTTTTTRVSTTTTDTAIAPQTSTTQALSPLEQSQEARLTKLQTQVSALTTQLTTAQTKLGTVNNNLNGLAGALGATSGNLLNLWANFKPGGTQEMFLAGGYECKPADPNFKSCTGTCAPATGGVCAPGDFFSDNQNDCLNAGYSTTPCPIPDGVDDGCYCGD